MTLDNIKIIEVPQKYYDEQTKYKKRNFDISIENDITLELFISSFLLFTSLCTINLPLAFFYTSIFIHFGSLKSSKYELYYNFMITSIVIFSYFLLLILSLAAIKTYGGINLHPNSSERPYFYFR
jgi:hypothetical protein